MSKIESAEKLPLSAFGDMRVTELSPILQVNFAQTVTNTEIGGIGVSGTGAVAHESAMVKVSSGTTAGSSAEWETAQHAKYKAGFGGLFRGTAMFESSAANSEQMLGLADTEGTYPSGATHQNGFGVGYDGTVFSLMRWSDDVLYPIAQTAWDDPMDGTGASGMTLDPSKLNVYFIQFQYLGAGAITLWIESDITGLPVKAHTLNYTNQNTVPSVMNPNFHMMLHIVSDTSTTNLIARSASLAYFVEGKTKYTELQQPQFPTGRKEKTSVTTEIALFTIRNKSTYNSLTNFLDIVLESLSVAIEASGASNLGDVRLVRDATLGGTPSYTDINTTDSIMEIDVAGTTVTGGKDLLDTTLSGKNDREFIDLTNFDIILGPGQTITVAASSSSSATISGSILWKELF